ncbi:MAG: hypothetical protein ACP5N2_00630 [Candidatus Nanoarchaeia archaeon]
MALFKLFKKNKITEIKEISILDVENWLENFLSGSGLDVKIAILKRDISSKIVKLNELLNELEDTKLTEEKIIPDRVKHIFEGNRKAFIDRIRAFMLELKVPEDIESVDDFLEDLSEKLNSLSEDTQKNYFILKEFVEDQVRPITSKIKDIDTMISNARAEFDRTPLSKVKEIRALHKRYDFLLGEIEHLNKELEHTVKMKASEIERKSKFDSKLNQLKDTKSYEEYTALLEREKIIKDNLSLIERDVRTLFSKIEYALKKRHNATQDELIGKYSERPLDALLEDTALKIVSELSYLKNNLKDMVLKKEKKESIHAALEEVSEEKVISLRKELVALKDELESVVARLKDNHYERSLKERENWLESVNKNIEAIEKKEKDIEDLIERLSPKMVKQKIKDLLRLIDDKVELK